MDDETELTPPQIPDRLPVLPIRDLVVFPYMVAPLLVARDLSVQAIDEAMAEPDRLVLLVAQRDERDDAPGPAGIYELGTVGVIERTRRLSDGRVKVVVQGLVRARLSACEPGPPLRARVEPLEDLPDGPSPADGPGPAPGLEAEREALVRAVRQDLEAWAASGKAISLDLMGLLLAADEPGRLADLVAGQLPLKPLAAQALLEERRPLARLRGVAAALRKEVEILEVQAAIQSRAKEQLSKAQREHFLREQLRLIQTELGGGAGSSEADLLRERVLASGMTEEARAEAERQLKRLEQKSGDSLEAANVRAYLEWLVEVPWRTQSEDNLDLKSARRILDEDHFGLDDVKDRILEHLGVLRLQRERVGRRPPRAILCFVGPPGVGKTSLGRSIARALGRTFVRVSLGGVRDEAEIRGHRRTYVGAMPGRVIQGMRQAGSVNPVIILDELDKLGADFRGDPSAALLEVLDPEQNATFRDHYLGVGYDLSRVLFIATANSIDPIPRALSDRMELIRIAGYDEQEKLEIARRHVLPRQLDAAGLDPDALSLGAAALRAIVSDYTREAGLRDLERQVAQICRKVARRIAEERDAGRAPGRVTVTPAALRRYLGSPVPRVGHASEVDEVGAATGLAWTPFGGEVLRVEAQWMPGKGNLILTGQLGEVMKESAMTALSYARVRASGRGAGERLAAAREIHVHVPAGAVPKDGPSAGVTMACALVSLITGEAVRRDVAMTGEITLRGRVLPVGGLKEKLLAAARAGMGVVVVPEGNLRDVDAMPRRMLRGLKIVPARTMDDVLAAALIAPGARRRAARTGRPARRPATPSA